MGIGCALGYLRFLFRRMINARFWCWHFSIAFLIGIKSLVVGNPVALWFLSFTRFFLFQFLCLISSYSRWLWQWICGYRRICNRGNGHFLILLMHCWVFYFNFNQLLKYINEGCLRCRLNFVRWQAEHSRKSNLPVTAWLQRRYIFPPQLLYWIIRFLFYTHRHKDSYFQPPA